MQHYLNLKRKKNYNVRPKTYEKVKALSDKRLINKDGIEATISYTLNIKPNKSGTVIGGKIIALHTLKKDYDEFVYVGEKGFKKMLKEWKEV